MSNKTFIILIACAVINMLMVGAGFYVVLNKISVLESKGDKNTEEIEGEKTDKQMIGQMYHLDTFTVNLADKGGNRFLRVTLDLEMKDEKLSEELDKRLPQIKDAVLMIIPSKESREIDSVKGKIALRDELTEKINSLLTTGQITNIYFTEFIIQ